jgi:hypothetical protein
MEVQHHTHIARKKCLAVGLAPLKLCEGKQTGTHYFRECYK